MLFAIQQSTEGVIWLTFSRDAPLLNGVLTHVYSFFSHVLWPVYVPLAVLLMEPPGRRRHVLLAVVAAGTLVGAYLLYVLLAYPVVSWLVGQHIEYVSPHFFAALTMTLYLIATTASLLLLMQVRVRIFFGAVSVLAFAVAYIFYAQWFISVWCFFAALLSVLVCFQLSNATHQWQPSPIAAQLIPFSRRTKHENTDGRRGHPTCLEPWRLWLQHISDHR